MSLSPIADDETDALWTVEDVETICRIPAETQYSWRHRGTHLGALSFKIGGKVVYRRSVVRAWLAEQERAGQEAS